MPSALLFHLTIRLYTTNNTFNVNMNHNGNTVSNVALLDGHVESWSAVNIQESKNFNYNTVAN